MDRATILEKASAMETKEDLLDVLNEIKNIENIGSPVIPITMKEINYYCNPNHQRRRYRQFTIKKKSGKNPRLITAPYSHSYKIILRCLNELFKLFYTPSDYAMGFAEGRSIVKNASRHVGMNYVFNIDLRDFFPSIEQPRVWKRLQLPPFNFPQSIANVVAGLCCMKDVRKDDGGKTIGTYYVLPQGAPTSPIITNMICDTLDRRLFGLAKRVGINYSRYADDITFSSMHNVYQPTGFFRKELVRIIEGQNFSINEDKTRLQKQGDRQEVTGVTVNEKTNVARKYVKDIRNILYIWKEYGTAVAQNRFMLHYKSEKGHVKKGNPDMISVLEGKLLYLKMVKGETDSTYITLYNRYKALSDGAKARDKRNKYGITYEETVLLEEFERKNNTIIVFGYNTEKNKAYAFFELEREKTFASIHKEVEYTDKEDKTMLSISLCRDRFGKQFWLIHKNEKTIVRSESVNIEELNKDLDALLDVDHG